MDAICWNGVLKIASIVNDFSVFFLAWSRTPPHPRTLMLATGYGVPSCQGHLSPSPHIESSNRPLPSLYLHADSMRGLSRPIGRRWCHLSTSRSCQNRQPSSTHTANRIIDVVVVIIKPPASICSWRVLEICAKGWLSRYAHRLGKRLLIWVSFFKALLLIACVCACMVWPYSLSVILSSLVNNCKLLHIINKCTNFV